MGRSGFYSFVFVLFFIFCVFFCKCFLPLSSFVMSSLVLSKPCSLPNINININTNIYININGRIKKKGGGGVMVHWHYFWWISSFHTSRRLGHVPMVSYDAVGRKNRIPGFLRLFVIDIIILKLFVHLQIHYNCYLFQMSTLEVFILLHPFVPQ